MFIQMVNGEIIQIRSIKSISFDVRPQPELDEKTRTVINRYVLVLYLNTKKRDGWMLDRDDVVKYKFAESDIRHVAYLANNILFKYIKVGRSIKVTEIFEKIMDLEINEAIKNTLAKIVEADKKFDVVDSARLTEVREQLKLFEEKFAEKTK